MMWYNGSTKKDLMIGGNVTKLTHKEESKQRIVNRIEELAILLGGTTEYRTCYTSSGLETKKIVIEYGDTSC